MLFFHNLYWLATLKNAEPKKDIRQLPIVSGVFKIMYQGVIRSVNPAPLLAHTEINYHAVVVRWENVVNVMIKNGHRVNDAVRIAIVDNATTGQSIVLVLIACVFASIVMIRKNLIARRR